MFVVSGVCVCFALNTYERAIGIDPSEMEYVAKPIMVGWWRARKREKKKKRKKETEKEQTMEKAEEKETGIKIKTYKEKEKGTKKIDG